MSGEEESSGKFRQKWYIAIDLKSFYASVEAVERELDPLDVNLVVADGSRTDKTICLAVSPPLKAMGVPGRGRLFEAKQRIREINRDRLTAAPGHCFTGSSVFASRLMKDPSLSLDMIIATPRMRLYMDYSRRIVEIYMRYVSPEDILVYSVDEVFIDATPYLSYYGVNVRELAVKMIRDVLDATHITATVGIGSNMYLAKVAMDIVAKKMPADSDGVRIAELDELSYRKSLWCHRPLTDFWRVGGGIARRLEKSGIFTMGDIARCSEGAPNSLHNEDLLYRLFGVNAELLIDHAWGWEPAEIADCRAYMPKTKSLSSGQVLSRPYTAEQGRVIVREMADQLSMKLVKNGLFTDQTVLDVCYDVENLLDKERAELYCGEVVTDWYGRRVPKRVHGSRNLGRHTASTELIVDAVSEIYDRIVDSRLLVRRFNLSVCRLMNQSELDEAASQGVQLDFFDLFPESSVEKIQEMKLKKERRMQDALLAIRGRYGKNSLVRGLNMREGATARERNCQGGGHKA